MGQKPKLFGLLLACALAAGPMTARAQDIDDLSLADLLGIQSTIATKKSLTARESPGIISIVTRDEIVRSGARDLMDILTMHIPGVYGASEIEGTAGIGIRGVWGLDSRVLFMMDGIELNDDAFGSHILGNHYPAELIERVEVIRGPGSVIYGGSAVIGVVNIITRGVGREGYAVAGRNSQMSKSNSHRNLTASMGRTTGDLTYDFSASVGEGYRGQGMVYADPAMNSDTSGTRPWKTRADITNINKMQPQIYNLGIKYKDFDFRVVVDYYSSTFNNIGWDGLYGSGGIIEEPVNETHKSYNATLGYIFKVSDQLKLVPRYSYKMTEPWRIRILNNDTSSTFPYPYYPWEFAKRTLRHRVGLNAEWDASENFSVLSGVEYSSLEVKMSDYVEVAGVPIDSDFDQLPVKTEFTSVFTEANLVNDLGRFVVGGRFEAPTNFKSAFVPRAAWTKAWDKFHSKIMLSQSFRAPSGLMPARSDVGVVLRPELVTNAEIENGYRLSESSVIAANIFDIWINDALVYGAAASGGFANQGTIGTRGAEAEYRYKEAQIDLSASVSFYQRVSTTVTTLNVPGNESFHRGAPTLRSNINMGYRINDMIGIYPSIQYHGTRFGLGEQGLLEEFKPTWVGNLNLRAQNLLISGLSATAGVMNITDARLPLVQGYDNGVSAVPNNNRALNVMVNYEGAF